MDVHLFLSTLPYLYSMTGPKMSDKTNKLWRQHEQVLHAISPSVDESKVTIHESNIFGVQYRYLLTNHVASIEPIHGCTGKPVGPITAPHVIQDGEDLLFDPALFRFYAVVLSSSSDCIMSPFDRGHGVIEPNKDMSSPIGSTASTSISRSESPKTPKVHDRHLKDNLQGSNTARRTSLVYTPMKEDITTRKMINPSQGLLYFGFQRIPVDTKNEWIDDMNSSITRKFNPIHFYCVDHFQLTSVEVNEESSLDPPKDPDSENKKDGDTNSRMTPPCILFHFQSCSFRIFTSTFKSTPSRPPPPTKSLNSQVGDVEYLYKVQDWIQRFIFTSSSGLSRPTTTMYFPTSLFSSYLHQLHDSFMTSTSMLVESSSSSGPSDMDEAGQRIHADDVPFDHESKGSDPPPMDIHNNPTLITNPSSIARGTKRKLNDDTPLPSNHNGDSWSMIHNLYSMIQSQPNSSIPPIRALQGIPHQLSLELSTSLSRNEEMICKNIQDCEQEMEKILQEMFPSPRHRVVSRPPFHRTTGTAGNNSTEMEESNRNADSKASGERLEKSLKEYEKLLQERHLFYLYPNRF